MRPGYQFKNSYRGMGYYKSASAPTARPAATPSLSAERKAMRDGLAAFAADNSARELYAVTRDASYPSSAIGNARYLTNGASDSALDELLSEARKDATLKAARVTRSGGTLTSHGVIVWKPASTASGRRVYKLGKPYSQWAIQDFTLYSDKGPKLPVPPTATGRRGKVWPTKAPPAHVTYRSTYCECCGFSYQGPQWEWDRTNHAKVLACDVCGSAMRGPVVESYVGNVVEGPPAGKAVIQRAAQSCELTRASHKSDALYVVAEAEGEYTIKTNGCLGTTGAITSNRAANFDAATLDRFKARSERIIYEQCLGDAVTESNRGVILQQAASMHSTSSTDYFSAPPHVNNEKAKIVKLLEHARFKRSDVGICLLETAFIPASNGAKAKVRVQAKLALTSQIFRPMEQRSGGRYRGGHYEDAHGRQNLARHLLDRCGLENDPYEEANSRRRRSAPPDAALTARQKAISKRHLKAPGAATGAAKLASSAGAQSGGWADTDTSLQAMLEGVWNEAHRLNSGGRASGLQGAITHLENVCHAEVQQKIPQLEVTLRDYQRQSVQFCLDQEALEGGIESHLFAEVPGQYGPPDSTQQKRLWYSPFLQTFSEKKPDTPKGGILAEEMGLGKTIISLALVLSNPALPTSTWGPPAGSLPGQGAIKTRATLVVCPVSLVSQWCGLRVCFSSRIDGVVVMPHRLDALDAAA
jgi:hypothetical protein